MPREGSRLGEQAKIDLLQVLALSEDKMEILLSFSSGYLDPNNSKTMDDLSKELSKQIGQSETISKHLLLSIFTLGSLCKTEDDTKKFLEDFELLDVTSTQVNALKELINKLRERNIIDTVADDLASLEMFNFGLPRLMKLELMSDHRLLTRKNGTRDIISSVLCQLRLRQKEDSRDQWISFQMSPLEVEGIISQLQSFKTKMSQDIEYLNNKLSGGEDKK